MAESVTFRSPIDSSRFESGEVILTDESDREKWRTWDDSYGVNIGGSHRDGGRHVVAVSPGEWIVIGAEPAGDRVDLTHVRAMIRVSGPGARHLLTHVCGLDLSDLMMPNGAAARTLVAGVATELVRDDADGVPAYLLLMSRSFARSVWDRLAGVAERAARAGGVT